MEDTFIYNEGTKEVLAKGPNYKSYPGGLGKFYFDRLKELSNESDELIAQIDAETGAKQTYKEFFHNTIKVAQYLKAIDIKPGDIVSLCTCNNFKSGTIAVAIQYVGAIMAATDPIISLEDTKYLHNMVKPKVIFVLEGSEKLIHESVKWNQLDSKLITFAKKQVEGFEKYDEVIDNIKVDESFEPFYAEDSDSTCTILFSSGTTGMPKGICLSHNVFTKAVSVYPHIIKKEVMLYYTSLYWIASNYFVVIAIKLGNARLLCKKFEKENHWLITQKYDVMFIKRFPEADCIGGQSQNLLVGPVNYIHLTNTTCIEGLKFLDDTIKVPNLNTAAVVGGIIPENILAEITTKLPHVYINYIYALTEGGLIAESKIGVLRKLGSVGKPIPNNQIIKIVDPETEEALPLIKVGEIRVKSEVQMTGYFNMVSSGAWDEQGFLKTGDLGYLDEEYNFFVIDRIKEMFKYRCWHVVPAKIEKVLYNHPAVLYTIVIGKPSNNEDENHAMAIVSLKDGANATPEEIETFANEQLDEINKIRAGVKIIDKSLIKFTPTGKIIRRLVKEMFVSTPK